MHSRQNGYLPFPPRPFLVLSDGGANTADPCEAFLLYSVGDFPTWFLKNLDRCA